MARNKPVYVYEDGAADTSNTGLVGDLKPIYAVFREEKNGISEIELRLPYDELQKWKACQEGCLIKCEVPVRVPPVIQNDEYAGTVEIGG